MTQQPKTPKPRPGSSPSLRRDKPALDQQPEREAVRHSGFDGVPVGPVQRKSTLVGLGAVSGETQPTLPAPNPLEKQTWRLPTPPSALAHARRTDPPAGSEAGPTAPETPVPESPSSGRAEDRERLLEAELAKQRAKVAELERQARVLLESKGPGPLDLPVIPSERPERITRAPESTAASEGSTRALRSALTKLILGLAALLAILAVPLTAYIQALTTKIERSTAQAAQANARADAVEAGSSKAKQEAAASKAELAAFKAYFREVMRLQGIEIAKGKDDPDAGDLKPVTPLCQTGKVCPGPQLIINVPP